MSTFLFDGIGQLALPYASSIDRINPIEVIEDAALLVHDGVVAAAGPKSEVQAKLPDEYTRIECGGRAVIPGLVDSHTHAVFAGRRVDEFLRRGRGETYEEIAAAGGGIRNTARAFVEGDIEQVVQESVARLKRLQALGTTTVEIKTGYGLSPEAELKHFEAIEALSSFPGMNVMRTLLAHVPPKHQSATSFLDALASAFSPRFNDLSFIDIFVESNAFSPDDARHFRALIPETIPMKLHVDQLHDAGGAQLAAELGAISADHLEFTTAPGMKAMCEQGVVATILPGCGLFLHGSKWPNARQMRDHGVQVAVATDLNPGSSHIENLWMCGLAASTQCGLTLEESFWGMTRGGALALGRPELGTLREGSSADLIIMDSDHWASGLYSPHAPPIFEIWSQGTVSLSSRA